MCEPANCEPVRTANLHPGCAPKVRRARKRKSRQSGGFRAVGANLKCELRTRILGLSVGLYRAIAPGIVFVKEGPVSFMYSSAYLLVKGSEFTSAIAANLDLFSEPF